MSEPRHYCSACPASFSRLEHLERHRLTHQKDRPFGCNFCSRAFKRIDVLQRHWRTCRARLDAHVDIPKVPTGARVNRRRACERCARLKKACNLELPCETCRNRGLQCLYQSYRQPASNCSRRVSAEHGPMTPVSLPAALPLDPPAECTQMTEIVDFAATCPNPDIVLQEPWSEAPLAFGKFRFLERFTSVTGFVSSFECMRIYEVRQLAESVAEGESEDVSPDLLSPTALDYLDLSCLLSAQSEIHSVATPHSAESFHSCASLLSDPLATVTSKLVSQLKRVTVHRGPGTPIALRWSPANERVCYQFFDSRNIRRYLAYYWSFWYPNCPIIHKPTFNVHRIPLTLLLPMLLVGSMFDPDESITQTAKLWFNSAEELVFADDNFHCDVIQKDGINRRVHNRSAVQALQGAYLMCLLQNWEGDDIGKRRIRRARFGMVTAIARELGFSVVRDYQQESDHTCWADFVAKEEFNRTLSYILLLDTAFVIFNNCPPKITISELSFLPVCPESCFQAETEAECFLFLFGRDSTSPISQLAIAGLISRICQGELDDLERGYIVGLGKLNLFIIVSAIHTLLFHARNTLTIEAAVAPIQRGLANWKVIWQQHEVLDKIQAPSDNQTSMQNSWKRTGFIEYAPEYWTLAHAIIVSIQQQIGASSLSNTVGATSNPNSEPGALLCRFDENDMKQLNRFIHSISNSGLLSVGASPKDL